MKKLYIVRHTQKDETLSDDYDRQLTQKGINDANEIGEILKDYGAKPDLIVSSPAQRTRQTAEILAKKLNYRKSVMYNEVLYMAYVNELIETITYTFDTVDSMVMVAHNPSVTALAITLVGFKEEVKMGGVVEIEFDCNSWIDICKENARLISYKYPKES